MTAITIIIKAHTLSSVELNNSVKVWHTNAITNDRYDQDEIRTTAFSTLHSVMTIDGFICSAHIFQPGYGGYWY